MTKVVVDVDEELIQMKKNKVQIWIDAQVRAKEYYRDATKKRKAAERELKEVEAKYCK